MVSLFFFLIVVTSLAKENTGARLVSGHYLSTTSPRCGLLSMEKNSTEVAETLYALCMESTSGPYNRMFFMDKRGGIHKTIQQPVPPSSL